MFRAYHIYHVLQIGEELLHFLRCLKNPTFQVSANTAERNRVEKWQHRSLGSCLAKPSSPREALELGRQGVA